MRRMSYLSLHFYNVFEKYLALISTVMVINSIIKKLPLLLQFGLL